MLACWTTPLSFSPPTMADPPMDMTAMPPATGPYVTLMLSLSPEPFCPLDILGFDGCRPVEQQLSFKTRVFVLILAWLFQGGQKHHVGRRGPWCWIHQQPIARQPQLRLWELLPRHWLASDPVPSSRWRPIDLEESRWLWHVQHADGEWPCHQERSVAQHRPCE